MRKKQLYGIGKTRWNRPYWLLNEMGVEFEPVIIDPRLGEHQSAEFKKLNPNGKLPVLVDGDLVLFESVAICHYLVEKFPEKKMMPIEPSFRAQAYQWIMFCATELESALWRIDRHTFIYPEEKRLAADIELAKEDYLRGARVLDSHMEGREFVAGDSFSVADVVLGYVIFWSEWEKLLEETPHLKAYRARLLGRPALPEMLRTPPLG
ncbi:MAG: glutathione S-transferase family protein [Candidatus Eremiobacteraeota bacterium]|nr:glutathione S-transferase family protein [Candidatus Eremiobacteraeota bacterium]